MRDGGRSLAAPSAAAACPANPGNGVFERAEQDFALVASLGLGHYRLSVEWSRVEPEEGRFDETALDRYRRIGDAARVAGLTPWVNFFHFTHPRWLAARGGFLAPGGRDAFLRYLDRAGRALRGHARHFHVQNESMVYVAGAYLTGEMPPFLRDGAASFAMTRTVLGLQAEGYRILKGLDPGATVATIEVYLDVQPRDPGDPRHRLFAERFDAWYHGVLLEALATGWVRVPGQEPVELPQLRDALDAYGFNYYAPTRLPPAAGAPGDGAGRTARGGAVLPTRAPRSPPGGSPRRDARRRGGSRSRGDPLRTPGDVREKITRRVGHDLSSSASMGPDLDESTAFSRSWPGVRRSSLSSDLHAHRVVSLELTRRRSF